MSKEFVKLIRQKGFKSFIADTETLIRSPICIKDANGKVLVGGYEQPPCAYPVVYDEKIAGWVCGETSVRPVADILAFWLSLEYEKKDLVQELLEKYREVSFYFNITEQLAGNMEIKDTARSLIKEAQRLIKAGDITLALINHGDKKILASSRPEDYARGIIEVCQPVIDSTVTGIKSEVINDFPVDSRSGEGNKMVSSLICAPLAIKNNVLGVMIVSSEQPRDFTAGDQKLVATVAYQTAAAIANAQLFARLKETIADLKRKKEELTESIKIRMEFGRIFINLVLMVCLYTLLILFLKNARTGENGILIVSRSVDVAFAFVSVWLVFRSRLPLEDFGVTLKNVKQSIMESLAISAFLMLGLAVLKVYLIKTLPLFQGETVFTWKYASWDDAVYILVALLQEFVCRGVLQGSIQRFLIGRFNWLWAIILSSTLFGVFHIHQSLELGLVAIVGGMLWGGMYVRHKNLIGVSISHFLIVNWLEILGLWNIITHTGTGG